MEGASQTKSLVSREVERDRVLLLLLSEQGLTHLRPRAARAPAQASPQQQCPVQAAEGSKGSACLESGL